MADNATYQQAIENAWSVYLVNHRSVDFADRRRSALERHLSKELLKRKSDAADLTCVGIAYLERLRDDE